LSRGNAGSSPQADREPERELHGLLGSGCARDRLRAAALPRGDLSQALCEFREALKIHPHDALAEGAVRTIRSRMN